eukprot:ANDGO_03639.mRNA.1 hypothetical protein
MSCFSAHDETSAKRIIEKLSFQASVSESDLSIVDVLDFLKNEFVYSDRLVEDALIVFSRFIRQNVLSVSKDPSFSQFVSIGVSSESSIIRSFVARNIQVLLFEAVKSPNFQATRIPECLAVLFTDDSLEISAHISKVYEELSKSIEYESLLKSCILNFADACLSSETVFCRGVEILLIIAARASFPVNHPVVDKLVESFEPHAEDPLLLLSLLEILISVLRKPDLQETDILRLCSFLEARGILERSVVHLEQSAAGTSDFGFLSNGFVDYVCVHYAKTGMSAGEFPRLISILSRLWTSDPSCIISVANGIAEILSSRHHQDDIARLLMTEEYSAFMRSLWNERLWFVEDHNTSSEERPLQAAILKSLGRVFEHFQSSEIASELFFKFCNDIVHRVMVRILLHKRSQFTPDMRVASFALFRGLMRHAFGVSAVFDYPGMMQFVLDRTTENEMPARLEKYSVLEAAFKYNEATFKQVVGLRDFYECKEYLRLGPVYNPAASRPDVAEESSM